MQGQGAGAGAGGSVHEYLVFVQHTLTTTYHFQKAEVRMQYGLLTRLQSLCRQVITVNIVSYQRMLPKTVSYSQIIITVDDLINTK